MTAGERTVADVPITGANGSVESDSTDDVGQEVRKTVSAVSSEALYGAVVGLRSMGRQLRIQAGITGHAEFDEMGQRILPIAGLCRTLLTERSGDPEADHYLQLLRTQETSAPEEGGRQLPLH